MKRLFLFLFLFFFLGQDEKRNDILTEHYLGDHFLPVGDDDDDDSDDERNVVSKEERTRKEMTFFHGSENDERTLFLSLFHLVWTKLVGTPIYLHRHARKRRTR